MIFHDFNDEQLIVGVVKSIQPLATVPLCDQLLMFSHFSWSHINHEVYKKKNLSSVDFTWGHKIFCHLYLFLQYTLLHIKLE